MHPASIRWIVDRNPFYLLSACCGLLGCWLLGDIAQQDRWDATMKIGGVLTYEAAVVLLAVWLAQRMETRRDAAILSVLTLALTADAAFFYTQAAMLKPLPATLFSCFGAAQALAIAGILLRGVRVDLSKTAEWMLAMDLSAVHLVPLALRFSADRPAGLPLAFWAAFMAAGALIAAHAWPGRWRAGRAEKSAEIPADDLARNLAVIAPALILGSLLAHVAASEWIYDVGFVPVFLSPICLGLAALCLRREADSAEARENVLTPGGWACLFSIAAVILAWIKPPDYAIWEADGWSWFGLSPLRSVSAAAIMIVWGQWRLRRGHGTLLLACGVSMLTILGHTPETIRRHVHSMGHNLKTLMANALPTSRTGWGAVLFVLAFLLLGVGAWVSWRSTRAADSGKIS